jgi:hypothetical protein
MRAATTIPLGCPLPLTGWHYIFRRDTEGTCAHGSTRQERSVWRKAEGPFRVFEEDLALEECRWIPRIPLGCSLLLPVGTANSATTLQESLTSEGIDVAGIITDVEKNSPSTGVALITIASDGGGKSTVLATTPPPPPPFLLLLRLSP